MFERVRWLVAAILSIGLLLNAAPAMAGKPVGGHLNETDIPVGGTLADVCSLDVVTFSGAVHLNFKVAIKADMASVGLHLNFQGVQGDGYPSGAHYNGNGTLEASIKVKGPFPAGFTAPGHFFLLRSGEGHDFKASFLLKGKVNGNGALTDLTFEIRQLECGFFDLA